VVHTALCEPPGPSRTWQADRTDIIIALTAVRPIFCALHLLPRARPTEETLPPSPPPHPKLVREEEGARGGVSRLCSAVMKDVT
jgi:hypothetical protein